MYGGRSADTDGGRGLREAAVLVAQQPGGGKLAGGHHRGAAALATSGPGSLQAGVGGVPDQVVLELGQGIDM
jgi:hypothetical protein